MANLTEDILRVSVKKIEAHVESIMMSLNILINKPESSDYIIDEVCELITKLSIANSALEQAKILYNQIIEQKINTIENLVKQKHEVKRAEEEELRQFDKNFPETSRINSDEEE